MRATHLHHIPEGRHHGTLRTGVGYFLIPIQTGVNAVGTGIYNELKDYGSLKDALREMRS